MMYERVKVQMIKKSRIKMWCWLWKNMANLIEMQRLNYLQICILCEWYIYIYGVKICSFVMKKRSCNNLLKSMINVCSSNAAKNKKIKRLLLLVYYNGYYYYYSKRKAHTEWRKKYLVFEQTVATDSRWM